MMPFWQRTPFEEAFWQDGTTRNVLLTIDRYFWVVSLVNLVIDCACACRLLNLIRGVLTGAVACLYLGVAIAEAVVIKHDPEGYYRYRRLVMNMNRIVRLVVYFMISLALNDDALVKVYVTDKLAAGRHVSLVLLLVLIHQTGNYLLWTLYFPLPFRAGVWLDVVQMVMRLMTKTRRCFHLLSQPALRPVVTSLCTTMNTVLYSVLHPMAMASQHRLDLRCEEDSPLLVSLFTWWFFGTFLPTFTVWYCESAMKERFAARNRNRGGQEGPGLGGTSCLQYLGISFLVACLSWLVLHLLLEPRSNRDLVVKVLLSFCH